MTLDPLSQDLFAVLYPPCGDCGLLDPKPINPGVHYCRGMMLWRRADERIDCGSRKAAA